MTDREIVQVRLKNYYDETERYENYTGVGKLHLQFKWVLPSISL